MKFSKKGILILLLVLFGSTYLIIGFGSNNVPYQKQKEYEEVKLSNDPTGQQPFIFDFPFPTINIPNIGGIFGLGGSSIGVIFAIFGIVFLLFIISLVVSYRRIRKEETEDEKELAITKDIELKKRRITLGKRIEEIIEFLEGCLEGRFSQGIMEGFEQLDLALKEFSKVKRPGWLTPREFTLLKIPYFNHDAMIAAVEHFYRITYGLKPATRKELEEFIEHFRSMIADENILKWKADSPIEGNH